jgi:hypothetical protein
MKERKVYIIKYNDCYGNGDTQIEGVVETITEFKEWFELHNKERVANGHEKEHIEEFDLIPTTLFSNGE